MHLISLSFDDGFKKSSIRTAEIFEKFGLPACINVVATAHHPGWSPPGTPPGTIPMGDFALWNELAARGHEVMPHGYIHANKRTMPFAQGRALIEKCFDVFDREFKGFDRRRSVFNFPYNSTTPELEAWLPTVVRAFRGGHLADGINPMPTAKTVAVRTTGFGPANCEHHLDACIAKLIEQPQGWLVYNVHGLDDEGWGPIGANYLERLLARLAAIPTVRVIPVGRALLSAA